MTNQLNMESSIVDFRLKQYESTRKEIEGNIQETRTLERYAIIVSSLVWVWLLTHDFTTIDIEGTFKIVWWIPSLLVILCALRVFSLFLGILRAAKYLRQLENLFFCSEDIPGWETFVQNEKNAFITWSAVIFWFLILSITVAAPFFLYL